MLAHERIIMLQRRLQHRHFLTRGKSSCDTRSLPVTEGGASLVRDSAAKLDEKRAANAARIAADCRSISRGRGGRARRRQLTRRIPRSEHAE